MKISQRKDGRYCCNVKVATGKYKTVYGKTKKEVREKAKNLTETVQKDEYVSYNPTTLSEWLDYYIENCTSNLKGTTVKKYSADINNHIKPYFKDIKIQKLTTLDIQGFINALSEKLSPKSVRNCHGVLSKSLNVATTMGLIGKNPCKNIILPKKSKKEMEILSEHEIPLFLQKAYELTKIGDFFELILLTGLRFGEIVGLTEDRYFRDEGYILIDRQQVTNTVVSDFTTPKHDVVRKVYLGERAKEIIDNRIARNELKPYKESYIFVYNDTFFKHSTVQKYFDIVKKAIGKENLRIHDLRHTHASMALKSGMDIKTLQTNLGHSTASFTLQVYGHTTNNMQQTGANNLESMLYSL